MIEPQSLDLSSLERVGTALFVLAVLHTFSTSGFMHLAGKFREGSVGENFFHLLGEVEIVFGFWAGVLFLWMVFVVGLSDAFAFAEGLNFTEPLFVFAIMTVAATRPLIGLAGRIIRWGARVLPLPGEVAMFFSCMVIGPLLGSFITEPAAMTVTALILKDRYFDREVSQRFRYLALAVLFVNVSIGGVLTPYAAPPVLMVAGKWGWGLAEMLSLFGWKAAIAVVINAGIASAVLFRELSGLKAPAQAVQTDSVPAWVVFLHLIFLVLIVVSAHHAVIFIALLLFFLGLATITREFQDELRIREGLLVMFFLGGLVVFGSFQKWWLAPVLERLDALPLFLGAAGLTAFTDNAALTYLGAQVEGISATFKYALVAGAVAGGGLTVIANAPNPAGYSILQGSFGPDGVNPFKLFLAAVPPTVVALICFWALNS